MPADDSAPAGKLDLPTPVNHVIARPRMPGDHPNRWVPAPRRLAIVVRAMLVAIALLFIGIFSLAGWLNPYDGDGQPRKMETHRQLGLPPCSFYAKTGLPCPSCGFTTSFAFTIRLHLRNALQANSVGAILALTCLLAIPWCIASAIRGRLYFVGSGERLVIACLVGFIALMLVRWGIVIAVALLR